MYKIKRYFKGVFKQGKMVRWPSGKELLGYFSTVVAVIVFSAVACSLFDLFIAYILGVLEKNLGGAGGASSSEPHDHEHALKMIQFAYNYIRSLF